MLKIKIVYIGNLNVRLGKNTLTEHKELLEMEPD